MSHPIEDYALIGDTQTAGLVCRDGSVDWLCLPRFDSGACFAALLGDASHGRWLLAPAGQVRAVRRRYRPGALVLDTEMDADGGTIRVVDLMPPRGSDPRRGDNCDLVRVVEGVRGRVAMRMQLVARFDYGSIVPWVTSHGHTTRMVAGPDALTLATPIATRGEDLATVADFSVSAGQRVPFVLTWHPSHQPAPPPVDGLAAMDTTSQWWRAWSERSTYRGEWGEAVERSLITLKALTYAPTGGIVAAPTTSLPESFGGSRNWDYRYSWLRDATFTLYALVHAGFLDEAIAWRDWLLRAVAGDPSQLQIVYGLGGERRLPELALPWLPGYEKSQPVRVGNAAYAQLQLDVYGEVLDALHYARRAGMAPQEQAWDLQRVLLDYLESMWDEPDHGIWEVRGPRRPFTHSRVMAWAAFDRAVKGVEQHRLDGPVEHWRALREQIHREVMREAYDPERNTFTQYYGSKELDASLLLIPQVGFLPPSHPRVRGTVEAVERELMDGPFVLRYPSDLTEDGLPPGEGAFLLCSFWFVDALAMTGQKERAREFFEQLMAIRNDVGLLAEECDPATQRQLGNFPQAFSHVGLINSACNVFTATTPARGRAQIDQPS
ncbi:MAG: glycoside hydrolase family 15 protein [Actinomycetota bacterium]|nr:glycoside hydrolase family 15 protein [Actinomycetota bacterium]